MGERSFSGMGAFNISLRCVCFECVMCVNFMLAICDRLCVCVIDYYPLNA